MSNLSQVCPRALVPGEEHGEVLRALRSLDRASCRLSEIPRSGRCERDDLLDASPAPSVYLEAQLVSDEAGLLDQPPVDVHPLAVAQHPGSRGQGDPHVRLVVSTWRSTVSVSTSA